MSTVFVTGSTGSQGFAVARQLLEIGWAVRTTARNMDSPAAKKLQDLGAEVTHGDWDNEEVLKAVINGCTHVFLNLVPNLAAPTSEMLQAKQILGIAKAAGVKHVVYSSGMAIKDMEKDTHKDRNSPIWRGHWLKKEIEDLVQNAGFDAWTIVRGGFFMCNTLTPKVKAMGKDLLQTNVWRTAWTPETLLPMMDVEDLARFAVAAFREPSRFNGKKIEIASEKLSPDEIMQQLGEASGRKFSVIYLTDDEIKAKIDEDFFIAVQMMSRDLGDKVDIESVRKWNIPLTTYRQFLERERSWVESTFA